MDQATTHNNSPAQQTKENRYFRLLGDEHMVLRVVRPQEQFGVYPSTSTSSTSTPATPADTMEPIDEQAVFAAALT